MQDANGLRRPPNAARDETSRMWLQLLTEIMEDKLQRDLGQRRLLPIGGIRPLRLSAR